MDEKTLHRIRKCEKEKMRKDETSCGQPMKFDEPSQGKPFSDEGSPHGWRRRGAEEGLQGRKAAPRKMLYRLGEMIKIVSQGVWKGRHDHIIGFEEKKRNAGERKKSQ